ncbi:hypothetical protein AYI70_g3474 [Smittium culicis]|uniref:Carbohydrate-binding module family 19 domain-containing protein n=1 Tax=Smittium culicis TaxID=133412 RepID=A0A1R1Y3H5_9FUNG|nr:hypothetical protein AYI70_g3474 [Smittium culicis]
MYCHSRNRNSIVAALVGGISAALFFMAVSKINAHPSGGFDSAIDAKSSESQILRRYEEHEPKYNGTSKANHAVHKNMSKKKSKNGYSNKKKIYDSDKHSKKTGEGDDSSKGSSYSEKERKNTDTDLETEESNIQTNAILIIDICNHGKFVLMSCPPTLGCMATSSETVVCNYK